MANLTLALDDEVLKQARRRALDEETSVNALVRDFLLAYTQSAEVVSRRRRELSRLYAMSDAADTGDAGSAVRREAQSREELHLERLAHRWSE